MSETHVLPDAQTLQERPTCAHCGSRMWLTHTEFASKDHERRIFACPVCTDAEAQAKIVKFK